MRPEERAARVAELFDAASEAPAAERAALLDQRCRADSETRAEVESLLRAAGQAKSFMDSPVREARRLRAAFVAGDVVDDYEIISLIGKGGMGEVYLATERTVRRQVAVKLVRGGLDREMLTRRFQREQELLASLNHPNIAQLYATGVTSNGIPFFAMEYVEGTRLDEFICEVSPGLRERLTLFRRICGAVAYAHQNLVIHRDLKPANIRVTPAGEPKLLDFGIAKLLDGLAEDSAEQTITMQRMLTPEHASPEQLRGERLTTASDVYSLGVLLYELLTGAKPYRWTSRSPAEIERTLTQQAAIRPSENDATQVEMRKALRGDLDNIVLMALRNEADRRYPSAGALSDDIRRYLDGLPVRARKDTLSYRTSKFIRRNRAGVVIGVLAVASLVIALAVTLQQKRKADRRFGDVRQMANSLLFEVEGELEKGPTRAREKLVTHAVSYLDRLAGEVTGDPTLKVEVAAGYLKVGDIQGRPFYANTGDKNGALASYVKAARILEPVAASSASSRDALRCLSQAWQNISRVQRRDGNWREALASARSAVAIAEKLAAAEPTNESSRAILADAYIHLGTALYKTEFAHSAAELTEALRYYRNALGIHRQLLAANPTAAPLRAALATDSYWVGNALLRRSQLTGDVQQMTEARENFRVQVEADAELLRADPTNNRHRRAWADAALNLFDPNNHIPGLAGTGHELDEAYAIFQAIAAADPDNVEARRDLAVARRAMANSAAATGDLAAAAAFARDAFATLDALLRKEPDTGDVVFTASLCALQVAVFERDLHHADAALRACEKAVRIAEDWHKERPHDVPGNRLAALAFLRLGELHEGANRWGAAQEAYRQSNTFWQRVPDDTLPPNDRVAKASIPALLERATRASP